MLEALNDLQGIWMHLLTSIVNKSGPDYRSLLLLLRQTSSFWSAGEEKSVPLKKDRSDMLQCIGTWSSGLSSYRRREGRLEVSKHVERAPETINHE